MSVAAPAHRSQGRLVGGLVLGVVGAVLVARALVGRPSTATVTYPPLDVPKAVRDRLWIVDSGPLRASGLDLPVRMTVVRLANGDLLLHSPTRFSPALAEELAPLGRIRHLVAPSMAHWMFVVDWQRHLPDARTWAAPGVRERSAVRRSGVRIDAELGDAPPPEWADEIAQGIVPGGAGFREVWFLHKPSRTLILADLQDDDPAVYAMIQKADTLGTFQIESRAQMSMLPRTKPRRFWLADITYIATGEGWLYLAAVLDLATRKIVGWDARSHADRVAVGGHDDGRAAATTSTWSHLPLGSRIAIRGRRLCRAPGRDRRHALDEPHRRLLR